MATGAPSQYYGPWPDAWPRAREDFADALAKDLWCLCEPSRLLDLLAHFIVFETEPETGRKIKKVCRYQQFRAVNKMAARVTGGEARKGLIWHTQGSGKSLTMVFAALKLKFHRGIRSERLTNPNLLVITDRKDLHNQISRTFAACGLPNPVEAGSMRRLRELVTPGAAGRTVLSTIFKFKGDASGLRAADMAQRRAALASMAVAGSENWILMVDEAHRTQEKDLGAYMRAMLPRAVRFGFTGTPVKKGDKNTFRNFGAPGEKYLDKYGIQDAVEDGATVPVYYQGRLTEWHLEGAEVDILFDQYFANEPEQRIAEIKARGVTRGDLARFKPRIAKIALDLWTHYRMHLQPDGFKAQVVAIDRLACVVYKQELDRVIARTLTALDGLSENEAAAKAAETSVCVYSPGQHDQEQHPELLRYQLDEQGEKDAIERFKDPASPLKILIVCHKLLTGFDAPIEQAMYLDHPLADHNLLQATARTNRIYGPAKKHGSIVDYIGVSKNLGKALAAYEQDDIQGALTDENQLHADLQTAHREVMALLVDVLRTGEPKTDAQAAVLALRAEDAWFDFLGKANAFMVAYGALSPDPRVLEFKADLKFVGSIIPYGKQHFEAATEEVDWRQYSAKIREILNLHLEVTGLATIIKLRSMADPGFWEDFKVKEEDLQTAAVRKLVEMKKETTERAAKNPARYGKFSERVQKLIESFQRGLIDAAEVMNETRATADAVQTEGRAFEQSGLNALAYDIFKILERFVDEGSALPAAEPRAVYGKPEDLPEQNPLQKAAARIDELYRNHEEASAYWQDKPQSRKKLLRLVRRVVYPLGISDWKGLASGIDRFAASHYAKP